MSQYDDDDDYDYDDKSDIYNDNEECRGTWLCEWREEGEGGAR